VTTRHFKMEGIQKPPTGGDWLWRLTWRMPIFLYQSITITGNIYKKSTNSTAFPLADLSTMRLYQNPEANSSSWTRARDAVDNVNRWLPPDGRDGTGLGVNSHIPSTVSGFQYNTDKTTVNGV
jgi:hypothetical protein